MLGGCGSKKFQPPEIVAGTIESLRLEMYKPSREPGAPMIKLPLSLEISIPPGFVANPRTSDTRARHWERGVDDHAISVVVTENAAAPACDAKTPEVDRAVGKSGAPVVACYAEDGETATIKSAVPVTSFSLISDARSS